MRAYACVYYAVMTCSLHIIFLYADLGVNFKFEISVEN